jgi:Transposase DDE domain
MMLLDGYYLVALDGTGYFSSQAIHCASCLHKHHRNGSITYYHQMLGAAIIHPNKREVIPLMPEPIIKQDGTAKNDCERNAAKRFIAKLRQDHPHLKFIITEDSLSSNAPHIETLHDAGCHYILGVKEGDHAYLFKQLLAAAQEGRGTHYERHDRAAGLVHRFRFVNDVPLNASRADVRVNVIEYWEIGQDTVQHFSWVTDLRVSKRNVYKLMRAGRARWKIENETFNTLKNQGYNFEHNYGHGEQNLSVVFATLMMLAFLVDQAQQLCCALFRAVWTQLGSKRLLWERMRALFYTYRLESMRELLEALFYGCEKSRPILITDTS